MSEYNISSVQTAVRKGDPFVGDDYFVFIEFSCAGKTSYLCCEEHVGDPIFYRFEEDPYQEMLDGDWDDVEYEKYARSHMVDDLDGFRLSYRTYEGCAVTPEYDEVEEYLSKHTAHPAAPLIGRAITELKQMRRA